MLSIFQKTITYEGKNFNINFIYFVKDNQKISYEKYHQIEQIIRDCGFYGAYLTNFFLVYFEPCEGWNIPTPMSLYQKLSDHSNMFSNPEMMLNQIKTFQHLKYRLPILTDEFIKLTIDAMISFKDNSIQVGTSSFHIVRDNTSRLFKLVLKYHEDNWSITGIRTYDNIYDKESYLKNSSSTDISFYDAVNYYFKMNEPIPTEINVQERTNIGYYLSTQKISQIDIVKKGELMNYKNEYDISKKSVESTS